MRAGSLLLIVAASGLAAEFRAGVAKIDLDPPRVDGSDSKPIAVLVHYACHPVVFGPDNLDYSADYPSEMRNTGEQALGGMAFFLQGAPGDINPYFEFLLTPVPNVTYSACLMLKVEEMFESGAAPYPVERTLLVSGILESCLMSELRGHARLETRHLSVANKPAAKSQFPQV